MKLLPVSATALCRRTLRVGDEVIPGVSLFPCFDRSGRSVCVMLVGADSSEIHLLPWCRGGFVVPLWSAVKLVGEAAWLKPISEDQLDELQGLWHYDPSWVLDTPRYRGHWAVEPLKATNCARRFSADVRALWFRRDLSRIDWVEVRSHSEFNLQRWRPALLPELPADQRRDPGATPAPRRASSGWRFDPIWACWTAKRRLDTTARRASERTATMDNLAYNSRRF